MDPQSSFRSPRGDVEFTWGVATHVGKIRSVNEDDVLAAPGVFVVADGMGGHAAGDVASRLTIDAFRAVAAGEPLALTAITDVVADANQRVRAYAAEHGHGGMGATVVGALLIDNAGEDSIFVFNAGDARCYAFADGALSQLTVDHSLVQEWVADGGLDSDQARNHPQRSVVTRAIGIEPVVAADFVVAPNTSPMILLLCSDGVHGELSDARIADLLLSSRDPQAVADALVDAVLEGRAADNITALVVHVVRPEPPSQQMVPEAFEATGPRGTTLIDEVPVAPADTEDEPPPDIPLIEEVPRA